MKLYLIVSVLLLTSCDSSSPKPISLVCEGEYRRFNPNPDPRYPNVHSFSLYVQQQAGKTTISHLNLIVGKGADEINLVGRMDDKIIQGESAGLFADGKEWQASISIERLTGNYKYDHSYFSGSRGTCVRAEKQF